MNQRPTPHLVACLFPVNSESHELHLRSLQLSVFFSGFAPPTHPRLTKTLKEPQHESKLSFMPGPLVAAGRCCPEPTPLTLKPCRSWRPFARRQPRRDTTWRLKPVGSKEKDGYVFHPPDYKSRATKHFFSEGCSPTTGSVLCI